MVCTAVYLFNRTDKSSIIGKSPYEIWFGYKPRITHLRRIASSVFVHIPDVTRTKLDPKAQPGYLVGYHFDDGYKIYVPEKGSIVNSHDVKFSINNSVKFKTENCSLKLETSFQHQLDTENISTPLEVQRKSYTENTEENSTFPFRSIIGSLMYLMCCTRPDIAFAISQLCQKKRWLKYDIMVQGFSLTDRLGGELR